MTPENPTKRTPQNGNAPFLFEVSKMLTFEQKVVVASLALLSIISFRSVLNVTNWSEIAIAAQQASRGGQCNVLDPATSTMCVENQTYGDCPTGACKKVGEGSLAKWECTPFQVYGNGSYHADPYFTSCAAAGFAESGMTKCNDSKIICNTRVACKCEYDIDQGFYTCGTVGSNDPSEIVDVKILGGLECEGKSAGG